MSLISKLRYKEHRSKSLIQTLLLAGVFPFELPQFDARQYAWPFYAAFTLIYIIIFTSYNITKFPSFLIKVAIVKSVLSASMCLIMQIISYIKRKDLQDFINMTEGNFYTYTDEAKFKYKYSISPKTEKITNYILGTFFIGLYLIAVLSSPIYIAFNKELLKSGVKMLTFTWVPFKGDTLTSFYIKQITLLLLTFPIPILVVGNVLFQLNIQLEFQKQFERLTYALHSIVYRSELDSVERSPTTKDRNIRQCKCNDILPFDDPLNNKIEEKLIECIKHYKKIIKAYKKFNDWFSLTYSVILIHSVLTLAMMSYTALLNIKKLGVFVKYFSILLVYTTQVYIQCYSGEKIYQMNEQLSNEIYNIQWYRQPASRRKLFYIFLCETQSPIKLVGIFIYPASLTIFSSVMKLSYSYLNLLRTYGASLRRQ